MTPNMERGARIIIHEWVKVRAWDKVLIVTSKEYLAEAKAMEKEVTLKNIEVLTKNVLKTWCSGQNDCQ